MAIHSNIREVLENNIKDEELLKKTKDKFHGIEKEIDDRLNEKEADENKALARAKELIRYIFGYSWTDKNWNRVEHDIKEEIEKSKR